MRHRRKTQNLSRFSSYYKATVRSLARSVLLHQRIVTTKVRAKIARRLVERLITWGKQKDSIAARRLANAVLNDHELVQALFSRIAPRFAQMNGGYTRIIPYKRRLGDNAELVVLELSVQVTVQRPAKEEKKGAAEKPKPVAPAKKAEPRKETKQQPSAEVAPPDKEKHKNERELKKPASKKLMGGFQKFFKPERDSL
jgi:large subunit ribosomal protein L17